MQGYRIQSNIEGTLDTVSDSLSAVKDKVQRVGITHQVEQRPWLMFGAAVMAGYMLGSMGEDDSSQVQHGGTMMNLGESLGSERPMGSLGFANRYSPQPPSQSYSNATASMGDSQPSAPSASTPAPYSAPIQSTPYSATSSDSPSSSDSPPRSSTSYSAPIQSTSNRPSSSYVSSEQISKPHSQQSKLTGLLEPFSDEIESLKGTAVDAVKGWLRDTIRENVPTMRAQVDDLDRRTGRKSLHSSSTRDLVDPTEYDQDSKKTYHPPGS